MTAGQKAKSLGVTLAKVREALGVKENGQPVVNLNTLDNWNKNKPELFKAVCIGVKELINEND